jgi:RND family efflux transporter MFP subunit
MTMKKPLVLVFCLISSLFLTTTTIADDAKADTKADAKTPDKTAAAPKAALAVTTTTPKMDDWHTSITATGSLAAWQEAVIAAEIGGLRIVELKVDVGDKIKRGQELATLATEAVEADLAKAKAGVAQAQASLEEAKLNANRARSLKSTGALPAQQIDQYLTSETTAQANLQAQQAVLKGEEIRLKQTRIVAVDDGVIAARSATLGSVVQTGTELFRMVRKNRIEWKAEIPGHDAALVQAGQTAQLSLPTGEKVKGEVRMIAPTVDANTRNMTAYVTLPSDSPAKAGMFAQGEIFTGAAKALTVPQTAVILRDGNTYVFEVLTDNRVAQRPVKTGRRMQDSVEITEGISDQARVVVTGGAFLNDGDTVQVVEAAPATPVAGKSP